jgi:hypothetical protein
MCSLLGGAWLAWGLPSQGPARPGPLKGTLAVIAHVDDIASHVVATLGAHRMRRDQGAALGAKTCLLGLDAVMRASLASARIRMSTLWNGHGSNSSIDKMSCFGWVGRRRYTVGHQEPRKVWPAIKFVKPRSWFSQVCRLCRLRS